MSSKLPASVVAILINAQITTLQNTIRRLIAASQPFIDSSFVDQTSKAVDAQYKLENAILDAKQQIEA